MMKHTAIKSVTRVATLSLVVSMLGACNWVDSTGRQSNTTPTIILDDGTPADGFSLTINEQSSVIIDPSASSDDDGKIVSWSWGSTPTAAGALDFCTNVDGFNSQFAANSLRQACTDEQQCEINVLTEEIDKTEEELAEDTLQAQQIGSTDPIATQKTVFTITAPQLKAPIGLTYRITAKDNDGGTGDAEVSFCLIAINEAPQAGDDAYTVIEGVEKFIGAGDPVNLLSNDIDDIDVTNQPLSINTIPIEFPQLPQSFNLGSDGSFSYYYPPNPSLPGGEEQFDSFVYEVTDGIHISQARVNLRVVTVDDPPVLISAIPDQTFIVGISKTFDFRKYFRDPEGSTLLYSETTGNLPASFDRQQLTLGKLAGIPANDEVGQYNITLAASDGNSSIEDSLVVTVAGNKPPVINNIPNQIGNIGQNYSLNIAKYASDPERLPLTYSMTGNPGFLRLQGSTIQGKPTTTGSWNITVSVSDGFNGKVSKTFKFTVTNSPPVAKNIPDQTAGLNQNFSLDASKYFSDPDGQKLTYSIAGSGTAFVNINPNSGVISGKFTQAGNFILTVTASDGSSSASDAFNVRVSNPPPVVKSNIPNKTITAGESLTYNVSPYFEDPNGDKLTFSASGLPGSLSISDSGVISGATTVNDAKIYNVTVTASDGTGSANNTFKLTVNAANSPPMLKSDIPHKQTAVGDNFSYNVSVYFEDPNGDNLTFSATGLPAGLAIKKNSGVISGKAGAASLGNNTVTITASDGSATATGQFIITVTANNSSPELIKAGGGGTVDQGSLVDFSSTFQDTDPGDALTITADMGGSGLTFKQEGNTGRVTGTANKLGVSTITITAKDKAGATATDAYTITVNAVTVANTPPQRTLKGLSRTVTLNTPVEFVSGFSDPDPGDENLTFTLDKDGAAFLNLASSGQTATVKGTSNITGAFTILVTATDQAQQSATDTYNLTVNP